MSATDKEETGTEKALVQRGFALAIDHLLNNVSETFAIIDPEGRVKRANIAYRRLSGPAGGAHDASVVLHLHPDQQDACRDALRSLGEEKLEHRMQLQFRIGREDRTVESTFTWLGAGGLIAFVGRDITEQGTHERERMETTAARDAVEQISEIGHWRVGDFMTLTCSPGAGRIVGLDPGAPNLNINDLLPMVEESDRARAAQIVRTAIQRRKPFTGAITIVRADGSKRAVKIAGAPSLNSRGQVEAMHGVIVDKTDGEAALHAALNADSTVRQFVAAAPTAMVMLDRDMRLMMGSESFFTSFRVTEEASLGQPLYDFAPWFPEKWREALRQALRGERVHFDCDAYDTPGGHKRWARWSCAPWIDCEGDVGGLVVIAEDVTSTVVAQHEVEASKERMDFGMSMSAIMVWELDFERRDIHLEGDWRQLFPERPNFDAITGNVAWINENDREALANRWRAHLAGGPPYSAEYRVTMPDDREIWHSASFRILKTVKGSPARAFAVIQDITDRKRIESKATVAEQKALVAGAAKSDFLANMSHEIRTPLNGVLAVSEMLSRSTLDDKQKEMVRLITNSGETLLRVMDDLVEFSRLEADQIDFEVRPFDLEEAIHQACESSRARAEAKGLDFDSFISASIDGVYRGDPTRIGQVITNLLNNAVKFTDEGRVGLNASVGERDGKSFVKLVVSDTGIGFSPEVAGRIFERFEQADLSTSRKYGGLGLGLSIVKRLVDGMDGEITVHSAENEGSEFEVILPIARDKIAALGSINAVAVEDFDAETTLDNIHLLVAEDNPMNRRVVELLMAQSGVELTFAENGKEAVEMFQKSKFDMVLMDLQMPVMGGLEATRLIRAWEMEQSRVSTPIIALSANASDEHVQEAKDAGADDHVAKPIVRETLFETIAHYARPSARSEAAGNSDDDNDFDLDGMDDDFDLDDIDIAV